MLENILLKKILFPSLSSLIFIFSMLIHYYSFFICVIKTMSISSSSNTKDFFLLTAFQCVIVFVCETAQETLQMNFPLGLIQFSESESNTIGFVFQKFDSLKQKSVT